MIFNNMLIPGTVVTDQITVTITGKYQTITYDGYGHSMSGYIFSCDDPAYKEEYISFTGTYVAGGTAVGTYTMGLSAQQFTNNNPAYKDVRFVVTDGYVTITPKVVTVIANDKSKTYGESDPVLTATVVGLLGSDTVAYTLERDDGQDVGEYSIIPSAQQTIQGNYELSFASGTFTIEPKAVTVTADGKTKTYGEADPALTATVTGLVGSDTVSYSLSRVTGENVGPYTITPSGNVVQGNYTVSYQTGEFTINKADASALGLRVISYYGEYDGSPHTITATVTVTSGTTLYYRTSTSEDWSTIKPTGTEVGTTTVYVEARNDNYDTASSRGYIFIERRKIYLFKSGEGAKYDYSDTSGGTSSITVTSTYIRLTGWDITFFDGYDTQRRRKGIDITGCTKMVVDAVCNVPIGGYTILTVLSGSTDPEGRIVFESSFNDPKPRETKEVNLPSASSMSSLVTPVANTNMTSGNNIVIYNWWFE